MTEEETIGRITVKGKVAGAGEVEFSATSTDLQEVTRLCKIKLREAITLLGGE